MCYVVYLSTTSPEDLSARKVEGFVFDRDVREDSASKKLLFPNRWRAGDSDGGCSCHFRHQLPCDLPYFGLPEEWNPEETWNLVATFDFIRTVRDLLGQGHEVDCVSKWQGATKVRTQRVALDKVGDEEFRFFENWHFVFEGGREAAE